jgi:hypothetical protein
MYYIEIIALLYTMLCDAIDECAAKTASALQLLSTNHDPPPLAFQLTHSFDIGGRQPEN